MESGSPPRRAVYAPEYRHMLIKLREARLAYGLTQTEVAEALGRPQSYVTKSELGERRLDPIDLARFAKLYRKPLSYFLPEV